MLGVSFFWAKLYEVIMFSMFFQKWMDFLSMLFQIVAAMYHYMAHLTGLRYSYISKLPSQQNWTKITPEQEFSSVITRQQILTEQKFQYNAHITAFRYFW